MDRIELEVRIRRGLEGITQFEALNEEIRSVVVSNIAESVQPQVGGVIDWGPKPGILNLLAYNLGGKRGRAPTLQEITEHEELVTKQMEACLAYRKRIASARASQRNMLAEAGALRGPGAVARYARWGVVIVLFLFFVFVLKSCFTG